MSKKEWPIFYSKLVYKMAFFYIFPISVFFFYLFLYIYYMSKKEWPILYDKFMGDSYHHGTYVKLYYMSRK